MSDGLMLERGDLKLELSRFPHVVETRNTVEVGRASEPRDVIYLVVRDASAGDRVSIVHLTGREARQMGNALYDLANAIAADGETH